MSKITKCEIPEDFEITRGLGAYKYIDIPRSWNAARKSCINFGGKSMFLFVIN